MKTKRTTAGVGVGMDRRVRRWLGAVGCCLLAIWGTVGGAGCSPLTLSMRLGPPDEPLREAEVLSEPGARRDRVAVIDLRGMIVDGNEPGLFGGVNPVDEFTARLRMAEQDRRVRAVIVRINSPGGTVTGSDILHREIRAFRERSGKPVVASLGEVAASGGYYVALAADEIVASPTTVTGSIGVIIPTINVSDGLGRIGVRSRAVTSGPHKDLANPLEPMRESQYEILQGMVDEFHDSFRSMVVSRRSDAGLSEGSLDEITDGRVFTGERAASLGLVDAVGGVHEAFDRAKALAEVDAARLVKYHVRGSRPRTVYGTAAIPQPTASERAKASAVGVEVDVPVGVGGLTPGRPYFVWLPGL